MKKKFLGLKYIKEGFESNNDTYDICNSINIGYRFIISIYIQFKQTGSERDFKPFIILQKQELIRQFMI